jgi:feruloyl esterase
MDHIVAKRSSLVCALIMTVLPALASAQKECKALNQVKLTDATILSAEIVPAGDASTEWLKQAIHQPYPAYCMVKVEATPSTDSKIGLEVWMPLSAWSGDYVQLGNGGLAGSINHTPMYAQIASGHAPRRMTDTQAREQTVLGPLGTPRRGSILAIALFTSQVWCRSGSFLSFMAALRGSTTSTDAPREVAKR